VKQSRFEESSNEMRRDENTANFCSVIYLRSLTIKTNWSNFLVYTTCRQVEEGCFVLTISLGLGFCTPLTPWTLSTYRSLRAILYFPQCCRPTIRLCIGRIKAVRDNEENGGGRSLTYTGRRCGLENNIEAYCSSIQFDKSNKVRRRRKHFSNCTYLKLTRIVCLGRGR
jgi:hypothetical protein